MYRFVAGCVFAAFILTTGIEAMTDTGVGHMYKLPVTQDVWLENQWNHNFEYLLVIRDIP
jgi:hypothetical protein